VVPGERFELPTNGLQNRCSTTELTRQTDDFSYGRARGLPPICCLAPQTGSIALGPLV
jgi:hypothetical protein